MSGTLAVPQSSAASFRLRLAAYVELTKLRIALLALVATAIGFLLALPADMGTTAATVLLTHTLIGTGLVGGGANALNQLIEAEHDSKMKRTAGRPIPSGRLSSRDVLAFGVVASVVGVAHLVLFVNPLCGAVGGLTLLLYVAVYTPLKRVTSLSVFVGAVPGALPPVMGWVAASGNFGTGAGVLFAILFFWQLPHFAAIAWLYRGDYKRAGYPVMPVVDPSCVRTDLHMITHSVTLLVASLVPSFYGMTGTAYALGAISLGLAFLTCGIWFVAQRSNEVARLHLTASLLYLPCLFALMLADKVTVS